MRTNNPKKILFVLNYTALTGVSTFTLTLLRALVEAEKATKEEIDVLFPRQYSNETLFLQTLRAEGFSVIYYTEDLLEQLQDRYRLIITNYDTSETYNFKDFGLPIKHFTHSLDNSLAISKEASEVFTFSERGYSYLPKVYKDLSLNPKITLIRQPIDLEYFYFIGQRRKDLDRLLLFDGRNAAFNNSKLLDAAAATGLYYSYLGASGDQKTVLRRLDVRPILQQSSVVIAVGRSALEAVATGKVVLIGNHSQQNGPLNSENWAQHRETNFSGWTKDKVTEYDANYFVEILRKLQKQSPKDRRLEARHLRSNLVEEGFSASLAVGDASYSALAGLLDS